MRLTVFLKNKWIFLLSQGVLIAFLALMFDVMGVNTAAGVLVCVTVLLITIVALALEFYQKSRFYNRLLKNLDELDKKYYISSLTSEPNFIEGIILTDVLRRTTKSMNDEIASYRRLNSEYQDYVETWIHEIKIPISCAGLICENNRSEAASGIQDELTRIDGYVEQALYYARGVNLEKDYIIREAKLEEIVKTTVKKYSRQLIDAKAELSFDGLDVNVFVDRKWLIFILGQLISNSVKYKNSVLKLGFSARSLDEGVALEIIDNGIGIPENDLPRVFDKGFTGANGRVYGKSTGIGLYLCRQLCEKMNLSITVRSVRGEGTVMTLIFPKNSLLRLSD